MLRLKKIEYLKKLDWVTDCVSEKATTRKAIASKNLLELTVLTQKCLPSHKISAKIYPNSSSQTKYIYFQTIWMIFCQRCEGRWKPVILSTNSLLNNPPIALALWYNVVCYIYFVTLSLWLVALKVTDFPWFFLASSHLYVQHVCPAREPAQYWLFRLAALLGSVVAVSALGVALQ